MTQALSIQFEKRIKLPVVYAGKRFKLAGFMDYSCWYGSAQGLETKIIVVEAKALGSASQGRHQLFVYMGMSAINLAFVGLLRCLA